jgi:hypothetical protein
VGTFLDELIDRWSLLTALGPGGGDQSTPWFLDEQNLDVFVASADAPTTNYLNGQDFADYINRVYERDLNGRRLRVRAVEMDETDQLFALVLRSFDKRLRRLESN